MRYVRFGWVVMTRLVITTIYNTITIDVESVSDPEVQEILSMPYVLNVDAHPIEERSATKRLILKRRTNGKD